jgi:hypothetical protein
MHSPVATVLGLLLVGVAAPSLHAATITFDYDGPTVGSASYSGSGSFSYNGPLTSVGLGQLTAFSFTMDLFASGQIPNPAIFDYGLADLTAFSATISGGFVTALTLTTDFQAATNTSNFDEDNKGLVVNSLAVGGAPLYNFSDILNSTTLIGNGTIIITSPTPEPSTALLAGGAALLLGFWRLRRTHVS